jgi:hypothetical protein
VSAYCDANLDVKVLTGFQSAFSSSTAPALTDVNTIIETISGEIDGYLKAANINTLSAAANISIRKKYCIFGVCGEVMSRWFQNQRDKEQGLYYADKYDEWTNKLINDPQYINVIIANEGTANESALLGNAVTQGLAPYSSRINGREGSYIHENFTY